MDVNVLYDRVVGYETNASMIVRGSVIFVVLLFVALVLLGDAVCIDCQLVLPIEPHSAFDQSVMKALVRFHCACKSFRLQI
jgi:hypothetical protein